MAIVTADPVGRLQLLGQSCWPMMRGAHIGGCEHDRQQSDLSYTMRTMAIVTAHPVGSPAAPGSKLLAMMRGPHIGGREHDWRQTWHRA
jgi:hypothetical protein